MSLGKRRYESTIAAAIEHLREAVQYGERGRVVFRDPRNPDTRRLVESELRRAFESLSRLGDSFWTANPRLPRERIGEIRQALTHDYLQVSSEDVWELVKKDAPLLLRMLRRSRLPAAE